MRRRDLLCCLIPSVALPQALVRDFAQHIPKLMREANVPGLAVAVIKDAKIAWSGAFGVRDASTGQSVDRRTMFEAASMSKPVFAYAVMKLVEKSVLGLDTPLTKYTPERLLDDPRLELITARHILSHTSGFQNWRSEKEPLKIHFTPGEKYQYSGEGYAWLQSVVTRLTGRVDPTNCGRYEADVEACASDFEAHMKANVFAPLGMPSSCYVWNDAYDKYMARPHDRERKPLKNRRSKPSDVARYGSAGALLTTAADYAKFLIEVIKPTGLRKTSVREMLRPHVKVMDGDGFSIWWGLGWKIVRTPDGDLVSHGGDNMGFHSFAEASVERRSGFVILTNGENGFEFLQKFAPVISQAVNAGSQ